MLPEILLLKETKISFDFKANYWALPIVEERGNKGRTAMVLVNYKMSLRLAWRDAGSKN